MHYSIDTETKYEHMFKQQSDTCELQDMEKALVASIKQAAIDGDDWQFDRYLSTYAHLWADTNAHADAAQRMVDKDLEGWDEVSNEPQTDPEISALRRDLNFLARHLCVTLPSQK